MHFDFIYLFIYSFIIHLFVYLPINFYRLNFYSQLPSAADWVYVWFGLVWFYGISIIIGYLMPNSFFLCI